MRAVLDAANDPAEAPLFSAPAARTKTALFVLSVFRWESDFDLRVQTYHCAGMPKGYCDSGLAWCLGQVHPKWGQGTLYPATWTPRDLELDVGKCARATIRALRASKTMCSASVGADQYSAYAFGSCGSSPAMNLRYGTAVAWVKKVAPPSEAP